MPSTQVASTASNTLSTVDGNIYSSNNNSRNLLSVKLSSSQYTLNGKAGLGNYITKSNSSSSGTRLIGSSNSNSSTFSNSTAFRANSSKSYSKKNFSSSELLDTPNDVPTTYITVKKADSRYELSIYKTFICLHSSFIFSTMNISFI